MPDVLERRRFRRYPLYCPIQYKDDSARPRDLSITLDMSEGGALISVNRKLEVSSSLIVRIFLKSCEFLIRSRVVHMRRCSPEDPYCVGIEFLERSTSFTMKFYEELETILLYQSHYTEEMGKPISFAEASMKWYRNSPAWTA